MEENNVMAIPQQSGTFDFDLDLSVTRKKRIRIDNDDSRILEINTSDVNVVVRLREVYGKLRELAKSISSNLNGLEGSTFEEEMDKTANFVTEIDNKMREYMDYIFDANVSEVCVPSGTMYDPFNGKYRFEHIIEKLSTLYDENWTDEFKKMSARVQSKTSKYTGSKYF